MTDIHPRRWFRKQPGDDGVIISREDIRRWLRELAATSDRLLFTTIGASTEGRPLDMLFIGDGIDAPDFDRVAEERSRDAAEARATGTITPARHTKPIALITSGIHATEIGGPQSIPELVHWLVSSEHPDAAMIRERVLTIIVPTLNPDGMDLVARWHERTAGTDQQDSLPPLLYHRFAGHDNNRDWLFRNLVETRKVLDEVYLRWMPHVTLDQHQMNPTGPRFVVPPYADPWEPNVHPSIITATASLGQSIATDLTTSGMAGVMTGRYFDAWEPSRALQHYRGGIRILAEAASANLAYPIDVSADQLAESPLPMDTLPSGSCPLPWKPGTWRLRDILDYHIAAAKSLLTHVGRSADLWPGIQWDSLAMSSSRGLVFQVPFDASPTDPGANHRLVDILENAGAVEQPSEEPTAVEFDLNQPMGPLLNSLLTQTVYPEHHGSTAYDVTTHHLPLFLGASIRARSSLHPDRIAAASDDRSEGPVLAIDARWHRAPEAIECALLATEPAVWRTTRHELVEGVLTEPGTWIIDSAAISGDIRERLMVSSNLVRAPESCVAVHRRDVVVLNVNDQPSPDHGWTRWWLHARAIPFLETNLSLLSSMDIDHTHTMYILAEAPWKNLNEQVPVQVRKLLEAGANIVAFGATGRALAGAISPVVTPHDTTDKSDVRAPGALVRLVPDRSHAMGLGLDRMIPAMFQRDGTFSIAPDASDVEVLARFAERDTLVSGWMSDTSTIRGRPAIVHIRHGKGSLFAFAFKPLFRGQVLVTSPLVHNLLYDTPEAPSCPRSDRAKMHADSTNAPTS